MKKIKALALLMLLSGSILAQTKQHKIVFQLATADTLVHKALIRQISNVRAYWPQSMIEVVIHNEGINFMQKQKSVATKGIEDLQANGVSFAVCENTLKRKNLTKADILEKAIFVPVGIAEIVEKQENGYSYIKAGY